MSTQPEGNWLGTFDGQRITIIYESEERTDTGVLVRVGDGWLQMAKENGEMILIPSTAIRTVKLLEMTHTLPATERDPTAGLSTHVYEPNAQTM